MKKKVGEQQERKKGKKNRYKFEQNPPRPSLQAVTSLMELEGTNGTAYCLPVRVSAGTSCIDSSSVNVYLISIIAKV